MKHLGLKLLLIILIGSGLVQLVLANNLCTSGAKISNLEHEKSKLATAITDLDNRLSQKTSLAAISYKAGNLGLISPDNSFDFLVTRVAAR